MKVGLRLGDGQPCVLGKRWTEHCMAFCALTILPDSHRLNLVKRTCPVPAATLGWTG